MKSSLKNILVLLVLVGVISYWGNKICDTIDNLADSIGYTECNLVGVIRGGANEG